MRGKFITDAQGLTTLRPKQYLSAASRLIEMAASGKLSHTAFKCGAPENARAWKGLVGEFFGGHDLVPACPESPSLDALPDHYARCEGALP